MGIGGFINHARNFLDANFYRFEHLGTHISDNNSIKWGLRFQIENIEDKISEWDLIDSSGYAIPYNPNELKLSYSLKSINSISTQSNAYYVSIESTVTVSSSDKTSSRHVWPVRGGR